MPSLSPLEFRETAPTAPFRSILYPESALCSVLRHPAGTEADIQAQAEAFAELLVRCHFKPEKLNEFDKTLASHAPVKACAEFLSRCETCGIQPDYGFILEPFRSLPLPFGISVERRFQTLLSADGFIPVFQEETGSAFILPFSFKDGPVLVEDWNGKEIPDWTAALDQIPEKMRPGKSVRVAIQQDGLGFNLVGDSLGLPVLMGWWRHIGVLPRYPVAWLLSTGAFHNGRLAGVATKEKKDFVRQHIKNGLLLHPVDGSGSERSARPLSLDLEAEAVLERIRPIAEERHATDGDYAARRLESFAKEIDDTVAGRWSDIVQRLKNFLQNLNPQLYSEERLRYRLILSAAYCHAGMTAEALQENRTLQSELRNQGGDPYPCLRLAVEELVALQDAEDWESIILLAPGLEQSIQDYASHNGFDSKALDLAMRYHGTLGQAHAYGTLAGIPEFGKDASRENLGQAVGYALKLFKMARANKDATEQEIRIRDVAQDDNYLYRWDTLFAPDHARLSFQTAWEAIQQIHDAGSAVGNRRFLLTYQAFGAYRRILEGGQPFPMFHEEFYDDLLRNDGYLSALTAKYLGAREAAAGRAAAAADYFQESARRAAEFYPDGVLDKIRMTIHAETFRSLRDFNDFSEKAEEYRQEALRFFASEDSAAVDKSRWHVWLENPDNAPFPGLSYWY